MKYLPAVTLLLGLTSVSGAEVYNLDTTATRVGFDIEHFGLHWVSAHFRSFQGDFVFDRTGSASRVDVIVQTDSVDCGDSHWNPHLRSPEWLDVQQFPLMTYRSRHIEFEGGDRAEASGDLTLHGVTHPVVLDVSQLRCNGDGTDQACRFVAHARVKRSDYGLPHGFWTGGDQVDITIVGVGMHH
ncbi:MAG TPA: YceI family protein [Steroidobacteraceae bacterium]|jgi:polyisoprenoid-binding protein YceI|nr:YceI family protein [Steroidobacteraceae bacterium]